MPRPKPRQPEVHPTPASRRAAKGVTVTGRAPRHERDLWRSECVKRGIIFEEWIAYACRKAFDRKDFSVPKED